MGASTHRGHDVTDGDFLDVLKEAGASTSDGFWSVPSPGMLTVFCENRYFHDHFMR